MPVDGIPKHLVKKLTRAKFEQLIDQLVQSTIPPCQQALKDAGLTLPRLMKSSLLVVQPEFQWFRKWLKNCLEKNHQKE